MERIFISHSSRDEEIIKAFIDDILIGSLMVKISDIFCTTTDGTKIHSGEDWRNAIKEHLINAKITFLLITPNYKESEICLNEMGAAWVLSGQTIPLIIEPINFESVGILQNVLQVEKLLDETSLDRIKDVLQDYSIINASEIKSDRWTAKKKEFLEKINNHVKRNPFPIPITKDVFEHLSEQVTNLQNENESNKKRIELVLNDKNRLEDQISNYRKQLSSEKVAEIENKLQDNSMFDELIKLCDDVREALSQVTGLIPTIIYRSYTGKKIYFNSDDWEPNIREAIARDFLIDDGQLEPDWNKTKTMRNIRTALDNVSIFIKINCNVEEFLADYEHTFEAPLDLSNLDFWRQLFGAEIYLD